MRKKYLLFLLFVIVESPLLLFSQDPVITQFSNTPLYYNPAYTGVYNGLRVRLSTHNQNPALENPLRSYHASADIADRNLPGSGGVGLIFNTDNDGLGFITNYSLGSSFTVRVPFTKWIIGQAGIKGAWLRKHVDWNEFEMSQKIHDNYGNIYDSGFIRPDSDVLNVPDFAIGGLIQFINKVGCVSGTVGAAVDHLFEPNVSLLPAESALLHRKWIGHADVIWCIDGHSDLRSSTDQVMKINPGLVIQHQHDYSSLLVGLNVTKFGLYAGLWYNGAFGPYHSNSIALLGGYRYVFAENMSIKFTYSYDNQVSGVQKRAGGAHEISLVLEFNSVKLFKGTSGPGFLSNSSKFDDSRMAYPSF